VSASTSGGAVPRARLERIVPWIAGAVIALPVLVARYPPMADLPAHEAAVGLLRHWGDARFAPSSVYQLSLGQPNQFLYFVILVLAYVVSVSTASKLVVAATLLLLPVSAARFADHLGVTRWTALLVAPIGLGWLFFLGLLANLMGLVAYLAALPVLDRFVLAPTARRFVQVAVTIVILHFVHGLIAGAAAVTLVVLTLCAWGGWRANLVRVAPALLVALLALFSRALAWRTGGAHEDRSVTISTPFLHRLVDAPGVLFAGDRWASGGIFALAVIPLILFALERWRANDGAPIQRGTARAHAIRFEIVGAIFVGLYFAAPMDLDWTNLIYPRFLSLAWCVLSVAAAARGGVGSSWRWPRIVASILPVAPVMMFWPEFVASDRTYRDLDAVIGRMEEGSSYAVLELGPSDDPLFSPVTSNGHIVAALGGRSLFDYTRSPVSPVVQRPLVRWTEVFERLDHHAYRFVPEHDLQLFRYVVLHTTDPGLGELARLAMEPEARLVFRQGELTLLESTLPRVPLDAPDDPFPLPHPASLDERAVATAKSLTDGRGPARE
jgi:hypothetical protein